MYRARSMVPNTFETIGKLQPLTLANSTAGPPLAYTRRWISAASRRESISSSRRPRRPDRSRSSRSLRRANDTDWWREGGTERPGSRTWAEQDGVLSTQYRVLRYFALTTMTVA